MITVDFRSRFEGDDVALDLDTFCDEQLPPKLDARGVEAGRAATRLDLVPLTFEVEAEPLTFAADDNRLDARRANADELVVALDRAAFSDLMQDVASTFGVHMTGRARIERGNVDEFLEWEPVLRWARTADDEWYPATWPKKQFAWFDRSASIQAFDSRPGGPLPYVGDCRDCPSTGGAGQPGAPGKVVVFKAGGTGASAA